MKFKIIKVIHSYSNNNRIDYIIYRKSLFTGWCKWDESDFLIKTDFKKEYQTFNEAEEDIIKHFSKGLGGIIQIDGNEYSLNPLSLPTI